MVWREFTIIVKTIGTEVHDGTNKSWLSFIYFLNLTQLS